MAWKYLKGCVSRPDFGILTPLLDHWASDFKTRPDAPPIMAQVLANRGGSLGPDLSALQERRMPIFDVSAALRQPQAFVGRYLVFVGKIEKVRSLKGQAEMVVAEQSRGTDHGVVFVGPTSGSVSGSSSSSSGSGGFSSSGVMGSGSGSYHSSSSRSSGSREGMLEDRDTFEFADTGRSIFVRLAKADPYLSTEHDYLFLVRFDGAKKGDVDQSSDEDPVLIPLVSLVSYHEVSASGVISR